MVHVTLLGFHDVLERLQQEVVVRHLVIRFLLQILTCGGCERTTVPRHAAQGLSPKLASEVNWDIAHLAPSPSFDSGPLDLANHLIVRHCLAYRRNDLSCEVDGVALDIQKKYVVPFTYSFFSNGTAAVLQ